MEPVEPNTEVDRDAAPPQLVLYEEAEIRIQLIDRQRR